MKKLLLFALILATAVTAWAQAKPQDPYVFAYFKEPANMGIFLALSRDGYTFTPLNDGQPWIKPEKPGEIMRDVFITRKPHGDGFLMVFTWGWRGSSFGWAESKDLMTWTEQTQVPLMKDFPTVRQVWAPETYWDAKAKKWLLIWSSSLSENHDGLRIWSSHTKDFKTFTKPEKFFDRGFPVIDATMFPRNFAGKKDWVLVLKDQTQTPLCYAPRWTSGPTVNGPWGDLSEPLAENWSEGPSVVQVGDESIVYYDHYRSPHAQYEGVQTKDWVHWESVNDKMSFPKASKHGSFFRVSEAEAQRLLARHDGDSPAPTH
jgi:hypothetical protein